MVRGNAAVKRVIEPSSPQAIFSTLPERRQRVQILIRRTFPSMRTFTRWIFGVQRRLVTLCAWLIECPNTGALPQISHCRAMESTFLMSLQNSSLGPAQWCPTIADSRRTLKSLAQVFSHTSLPAMARLTAWPE